MGIRRGRESNDSQVPPEIVFRSYLIGKTSRLTGDRHFLLFS